MERSLRDSVLRSNFFQDAGFAVVKSAPPAGVAFLTADKLVTLATLFYVLLQAAYLIWRWKRDAKTDKCDEQGDADGSEPHF
ncbi:holin [Xylella fastidiosa Mul-MD]|nr:holin [Xylella fastidiosa Mul-MD]